MQVLPSDQGWPPHSRAWIRTPGVMLHPIFARLEACMSGSMDHANFRPISLILEKTNPLSETGMLDL